MTPGAEDPTNAAGGPRVVWSDLTCVADGRCHVLVRVVEAGDRRLVVAITPSDNPGASPVQRYEALFDELTATLGSEPDDVLIAFPQFPGYEWIHVTGRDVTGSERLTTQQVAALVGDVGAALPPAEACRCSDLAPGHPLLAFLPDPQPQRSPMRDLAVVELAALPWPHQPFRCLHADRFEELAQHYPPEACESGVVGAHWSTTLTASDMGACRFHQVDWKAAAAVAVEIAGSQAPLSADAVADAIGGRGLSEPVADAALSLFVDPIIWTPGSAQLTNGQHRLCAMRFAGARRCVVDTAAATVARHAGPDSGPRAQATAAVASYWTQRAKDR